MIFYFNFSFRHLHKKKTQTWEFGVVLESCKILLYNSIYRLHKWTLSIVEIEWEYSNKWMLSTFSRFDLFATTFFYTFRHLLHIVRYIYIHNQYYMERLYCSQISFRTSEIEWLSECVRAWVRGIMNEEIISFAVVFSLDEKKNSKI